MTYINKTFPTLSEPESIRQPWIVKAATIFIQAFHEALDMRRKAHKNIFLGDE